MTPDRVAELVGAVHADGALSWRAMTLYTFIAQTASEDMRGAVWESNQKAAARSLGMDQTTVSRILSQLVERNYLIPDRADGHARSYRIVIRSARSCALPQRSA